MFKTEFENFAGPKAVQARKKWSLFVVAAAGLYSLGAGSCVLFKVGNFSELSSSQQVGGLAAVLLTGLLILAGRLLRGFLPVFANQRTRIAIYVSAGFLVGAWLWVCYQLAMTRFQLDVGQLVTAFLWVWIPMGAFCGLIYGLEDAALKAAQRPPR